MSGDTSLGHCDTCGEDIGAEGWMFNTGRVDSLEVDGPEFPVYEFFCSEVCCTTRQRKDDQ